MSLISIKIHSPIKIVWVTAKLKRNQDHNKLWILFYKWWMGTIMGKLLVTLYLLFSFLSSLYLHFVLCIKSSEWAKKSRFFFLLNIWQTTKCGRYMKHYLLTIFFLSALILLSINNNDQKKQFSEFCLFCFLGWSLGFCILLGIHSCFILKHVNIEQNLGAGRETWSGLLVFICLFIQVSRAWKAFNSLDQTSLFWMKLCSDPEP